MLLDSEEAKDADNVLADFLEEKLAAWQNSVELMELGVFTGEEIPSMPGSLCYNSLFERTQQVIKELKDGKVNHN